MHRIIFVLFVSLVGCGQPGDGNPNADRDGDGYAASIDCDDSNPMVYPGAEERCDSIDNNCDGAVDTGSITGGTLYFQDIDGDGFGNGAVEVEACGVTEGVAEIAGDCDDEDSRFHPGATEEDCTDSADYNCDGSVGYEDADGDGSAACEDCDDSNPNAYPNARWFLDKDGDGYGVAVMAEQCLPPEGFVSNVDDCDDRNALIHPETIWYADSDGDGFGTWESEVQQCEQPDGYVFEGDDCNDEDAEMNPLTVWYRDADLDGYGTINDTLVTCAPATGYVRFGNDCDDSDSALSPLTKWLVDADGDGFGDRDNVVQSCVQPDGTSTIWEWDCDDGDATINPTTRWYPDADGDGYGNEALPIVRCEAPTNYVSDASDCDDGNTSVHPMALEQCDNLDHNCDGSNGLEDCTDCEAIKVSNPMATDGVFKVDIDGVGSTLPFDAQCDMTKDGGGWTLFWWHDSGTGLSGVKDVLAQDLWDCNPKTDGSCGALLPADTPREMMVVDADGNWATWGFDSSNSTSELVLDALTSGAQATLECGDIWNPLRQGGPDMGGFGCSDGGTEDSGCACFEYDSIASMWSFALSNNEDRESTAFSAGHDGFGNVGVDVFNAGGGSHSVSRALEVYWR